MHAREQTLEVGAPNAWRASLTLQFAHDDARTWLSRRSHSGPLVVQKALYPEGPQVCQAIIVHPPGGIANGDQLAIAIDVADGGHAQIATPGAAKWYRGNDGMATQTVRSSVADSAVLEWLPHGAIVYDGARASLDTRIALSGSATYIGWDIVCLGRIASGERFETGVLHQSMDIVRDDALLWSERAILRGGSPLLTRAPGLNGSPVFGTFVAASIDVSDETRDAARAIVATEGSAAVTRLPGALIARYVGESSETAFAYCAALWRTLRPRLVDRAAVPPRIWKT